MRFNHNPSQTAKTEPSLKPTLVSTTFILNTKMLDINTAMNLAERQNENRVFMNDPVDPSDSEVNRHKGQPNLEPSAATKAMGFTEPRQNSLDYKKIPSLRGSTYNDPNPHTGKWSAMASIGQRKL